MITSLLRAAKAFLVVGLLGLFTSMYAEAATLYVDLNSANPVAPFGSWATAATNIQDAVDASVNGDLVLVTNGVYATGGRRWVDSGTNRVTLTNGVTLRSVNGPALTWIVGTRVLGTGSALTNAARCIYMGNNAVVSGFTLTNGQGGFGNYPTGGGTFGGTATNCVIVGNLATNSAGGGAFRTTLIDCQIIGNSASTGGGACACTLTRCTVVSNNAANGAGIYGGGAYGASVLTNCELAGNAASAAGGGANGGTLFGCSISNNIAVNGGGVFGSLLYNCLLAGNSAGNGGGIYGSAITNCTVVSNVATNSGGGIYGGTGAWCYNSILYYNSAPTGSNQTGTKFNNCCTQPNFSDGGITNEPLFVNLAGGNFHLQSNSPCITSGNNSYVSSMVDLDGQPRIVGGTVDIGAYEYATPSSVISYAWLQQYGFPIDGSVDFVDSDGDGMNSWQEWKAGTSPTNALSKLAVQSVAHASSGAGVTVTWQSVFSQTYYLQRSTNLAQPAAFLSVQSNVFGQAGTTSFIDRSATNPVPYFYRVGVQ